MKKVFYLGLMFCLYTSMKALMYAEFDDAIVVRSPQECYRQNRSEGIEEDISPTILVLHYTAAPLKTTLKIFLGKFTAKVSSHYTISEDGIIFQHVEEKSTAYHAGVSYWDGKSNLNKDSIGIEHVNLGYKETFDQPKGVQVYGDEREWYPFDDRQILSGIPLYRYLIQKYNIAPENVVGHSDVSPRRKSDPGPLFPWEQLARHGIGAWPNKSAVLPCLQDAIENNNLENWVINHLFIWGYKNPDETASALDIIRTFQMHFRQSNISGEVDLETAKILNDLISTYKIKHDNLCPCAIKRVLL